MDQMQKPEAITMWGSPQDMSESVHVMSPNMMPSSLIHSLECSDSSKQDSGFCSLTPQSSCSAYAQNYAQSTPFHTIGVFQTGSFLENPSSDLDFLPKITAPQTFSIDSASSEERNSGLFSVYNEAIDTSLYPDMMDIEEPSSTEEHSSFSLADVGEERSIDIGELYLSPRILRGTEIKNVNSLHTDAELLDSSIVHSKVDNETTPTKNKDRKTTGKFPEAAGKVTKILKVLRSFSLCGIEKLDFFYQLSVKKSYPLTVRKILGYLSDEDLQNVRLVSKTWNNIVDGDFTSYNRFRTLKKGKENFMSRMEDGSPLYMRGEPSSPMRVLNNIGNYCSPRRTITFQCSPPVSPKSARFHSFQKASKTLKMGERLLKCPKCFFASKNCGDPTAQCTRPICQFHFCLWCRFEVFPNMPHVCPSLYSPNRLSQQNTYSIGSNRCKRSLRRLSKLH